jgi:hypothetical protein
MEKTPKHASLKIATVIDGLNARWDLQLPRSHGQNPVGIPNPSAIAAKCISCIKFLCWKETTVDVLIVEFEEAANPPSFRALRQNSFVCIIAPGIRIQPLVPSQQYSHRPCRHHE